MAILALKKGISAEIYKYRSTFVFWFVLLAPAFIPAINLIAFLRRGDAIVARGGTAWENLMQFSSGPANFLFPFFVIIVALFVNTIESNSNTWKLIYAQPLSRLNVFCSKMLVYIAMLFCSLMLFGLMTYAVGWLVHLANPDLGFADPFNLWHLLGNCFTIFLATLGFGSIHFYLSQRTKNLILSLGIGVGGIVSFMILVQGWEYARYHPYGYHVLSSGPVGTENFSLWSHMEPVYLSLALAAVVFSIAAIDTQRKRII
ncbi:MAG: ABC transporter permease [Bacteroidota bacterium]|nr:ABC transporter permease [Bacteroidota bacterium]